MDSNKRTLAVYQNNFDAYVSGTAQQSSGVQKKWIDGLLSQINKESSILEIGSAFGRDAEYIKNAGYDITPTDAFDAAVAALKERGFTNARKSNVLTDVIEGQYDLILAMAVFLHFTEVEFEMVLKKIRAHLSNDGILGFTVKKGFGEDWSDHKMGEPRFFHFWQEEDLRKATEECGYEVLEIGSIDDSDKWLAVTCRLLSS